MISISTWFIIYWCSRTATHEIYVKLQQYFVSCFVLNMAHIHNAWWPDKNPMSFSITMALMNAGLFKWYLLLLFLSYNFHFGIQSKSHWHNTTREKYKFENDFVYSSAFCVVFSSGRRKRKQNSNEIASIFLLSIPNLLLFILRSIKSVVFLFRFHYIDYILSIHSACSIEKKLKPHKALWRSIECNTLQFLAIELEYSMGFDNSL